MNIIHEKKNTFAPKYYLTFPKTITIYLLSAFIFMSIAEKKFQFST